MCAFVYVYVCVYKCVCVLLCDHVYIDFTSMYV